MATLTPGDRAPAFEALDQNKNMVRSADYSGQQLFLFFYPKANTSGWATQAQSVRDALTDLAKQGVAVLGISPDSPETQKRFDDKHQLGFPLLSDPEHLIADAYGTWGEKKMYGKTYMGIIRSSFIVETGGIVGQAWYKISPKNTVPQLIEHLKRGS